ncbi:hypothetical protein ACZ87_02855 [Candidatus Erwinia dacicola]|uniref:Uncharacterized protein n=1 Tax=Candidatus Erwinia dacicola TaxID=252393 RepID=A0A328TLN8_9GAMM|nr:hypothetical protein ACZ87_02855 [Candidatus Erwinia dacicola]
MDIYHYLNKKFYDSCSKIANSWQKRKDQQTPNWLFCF